MLHNRKVARDFMLNTDRPTFLEIVYRAKVTPRQKSIILLYLLDKNDCGFIADKLAISVETVKADLQKAYDLIFSYLLKTEYIPNE